MAIFRKRNKKYLDKLEYQRKSDGEVWEKMSLLFSYKMALKKHLEELYKIYKSELKNETAHKTAFELGLTMEYVHYAAFYVLVNDVYWLTTQIGKSAEEAAILTDYIDANYEFCSSCFAEIDDDFAPEVRIALAFLLFYDLDYDAEKYSTLVIKCKELFQCIADFSKKF